MITSKKELKEYLRADFDRYPNQRLPFLVRWFTKDEQTRVKYYIWVLRNTEYYVNSKSIFSWFWQFWYRRLSNSLRVYVNLNCCDKGLRIVHIGGGVYLNPSRIGMNFAATTGVVIGKKGSNENRPIIGSDVNFTLGSKAYGKITIGNNVVVLPNSVVIRSVSDGAMVSGIPAEIVPPKIS